jgi:hypothetical protein
MTTGFPAHDVARRAATVRISHSPGQDLRPSRAHSSSLIAVSPVVVSRPVIRVGHAVLDAPDRVPPSGLSQDQGDATQGRGRSRVLLVTDHPSPTLVGSRTPAGTESAERSRLPFEGIEVEKGRPPIRIPGRCRRSQAPQQTRGSHSTGMDSQSVRARNSACRIQKQSEARDYTTERSSADPVVCYAPTRRYDASL